MYTEQICGFQRNIDFAIIDKKFITVRDFFLKNQLGNIMINFGSYIFIFSERKEIAMQNKSYMQVCL